MRLSCYHARSRGSGVFAGFHTSTHTTRFGRGLLYGNLRCSFSGLRSVVKWARLHGLSDGHAWLASHVGP